jgi:tetratricopeptide (TPR) repeat protein
MNFQIKVLNLLYIYKEHIDILDKKSGDILALFNKIDIYGDDIVNSIDNFNDILFDIRRDKDKSRKDYNIYQQTKDNISKILEEIDSIFNDGLSKIQLKERSNDINLKEIKHQNPNIKRDYKECIRVYTEAIEVNRDKKLKNQDNGFLKSLSIISAKITDSMLVDLNPYDEDNYFQRGCCHQKLREYHKAISDYSRAIKLSDNIEEYYEYRVECYMKIDDYNSAIFDYHRLIELNPNYKIWYLKRAECYEKLDDFHNSLEDYKKLIEFNPKDISYYISIAKNYQKLGFYHKVSDAYSQAIKLDTDSKELYYLRAKSLFKEKKYEESISDLDRLIKLDSNPKYYYLKAESLRYLNPYSDSMVENYKKAIELNYQNANCYYQISKYMMGIDRLKLDEKDIDESILDSIFEESDTNTTSLYRFSYQRNTDDELLIDRYLNKAIELDNTNPKYYYLKAENLLDINEVDNKKEIYRSYKKAIELGFKNANCYFQASRHTLFKYNLDTFFEEQKYNVMMQKDYRLASKYIDKALELKPYNSYYQELKEFHKYIMSGKYKRGRW